MHPLAMIFLTAVIALIAFLAIPLWVHWYDVVVQFWDIM